MFCGRAPGLAPAGELLSFASPKESSQRKGDPTVCDPPLRYGQPGVLDSGGGPQNSLRSNSCGPDPASICAPRRIQKGWERAAFALARPQDKKQIDTNHPTRGAPARNTAGEEWSWSSSASSQRRRPRCPDEPLPAPHHRSRGAGEPTHQGRGGHQRRRAGRRGRRQQQGRPARLV